MKNYKLKFEELMSYANRYDNIVHKLMYLSAEGSKAYHSMLNTSIVSNCSLYMYYHNLQRELNIAVDNLKWIASKKVKGTGKIASQQQLNLKS